MHSQFNVVIRITMVISIIIISFPSFAGATVSPSAVINQTEILPGLNDVVNENQTKPTGLAIGQAQTIQNEDIKLVATDGVAGDEFGRSVSIDGDTMVVGAKSVDGDIGAAYVFELVNGSWVETAKLRPTQLTGRVDFGFSVVVKNDTIVVGAHHEDTPNGSETGAVYIFEQDQTGAWNQTQKLFPAGSNGFGLSVDMTNDMLVVGDVSDATVYVFEPNQTGSWVETAQLTTTDDLGFGFFADNIAIQNTTVAVTNFGDSTNGPLSGAVYIFDQAGNGSWSQTQKLIPNDNASGDAFGYDVAFKGDRIVVGATNDDDHGSNSGAVYLFDKVNGSWTETAKLTDSDNPTQNNAYFGRSVAVENDFIVVGNTQAGRSAYLFEYVSPYGWLKTTSLTTSSGSNSHDPNGIAIQNGLVVAGSDDAEAVYLYQANSMDTQIMTLDMTAPASLASPTGNLTYTLVVTNDSPLPLANVTFNTSVPSGTEHVSGGTLTNNDISWNIGTVAPGASQAVEVVMRSTGSTGTVTNDTYSVTAELNGETITVVGTKSVRTNTTSSSSQCPAGYDYIAETWLDASFATVTCERWKTVGKLWKDPNTGAELSLSCADEVPVNGINYPPVPDVGDWDFNATDATVGGELQNLFGPPDKDTVVGRQTGTGEQNIVHGNNRKDDVPDKEGQYVMITFDRPIIWTEDSAFELHVLYPPPPAFLYPNNWKSGQSLIACGDGTDWENMGNPGTSIPSGEWHINRNDAQRCRTDLSNPIKYMRIRGDRSKTVGADALSLGHICVESTSNPTPTPTNTPTPTPTATAIPPQLFLTGECPFCDTNEKNLMIGGPINTANGNYTYRQSAPSVAAVGAPLRFEWTYNSLNSGIYPDLDQRGSLLGIGWSHNYDTKLEFPDSDTIIFQAGHGTPFTFDKQPDGSYQAKPGVRAILTESGGQYTIQAANQTRYVFNSTGQITSQFDPQGNETSYSYDGNNRLSTVTDVVSQRDLTFSYNSSGQLELMNDFGNRDTWFYYNNDGLLIEAYDTRSKEWEYEYTMVNGFNLLSKVIDPDGRVIEETTYDQYGRATEQIYRGETITIEYDDTTYERTITDGLGRVTVHQYNEQLLLEAQTDADSQSESYLLDSNANRDYKLDRKGNETYYTRNAMGKTTRIIDDEGNAIDYEYDANNNLTKIIDGLGNETSYTYDSQNNLLTTTDDQGNVTSRTYNSEGQLLSETDARGKTTDYDYDSEGNLTEITDALGNIITYDYDNLGRLTEITDPLGNVTLNEYDAGDNLIKVTENYLWGQSQNYQNEYNLVTEYEYDDTGNRIKMTDTLGRVTTYEYDNHNRLVKTIENDHPVNNTQNYQNQYNLITTYQYDVVGNQTKVTDTLGRVTQTEYDNQNRVSSTIVNYDNGIYSASYPDQDIITEYTYDLNGNQETVTDVLGRVTRLEYNTLNQVERTIMNYDDGTYSVSYPDQDIITEYTYDANGNQETVTDVLGRVTRTEYNNLNQVERTIVNYDDGLYDSDYPDQDIITEYTYDATGNQQTVTDVLGRMTTYHYDDLNRVERITDQAGHDTIYGYDQVGNRDSMTNAEGETTDLVYDTAYRVIQQIDALNNITYFAYDALGNRVSLTDGNNNTTSYYYDALNRVDEVWDAENNYVRYEYDALSNKTGFYDANGTFTSYIYDALNRQIEQVVDSSTIYEIEYDGVGNQVRTTDPNRYETVYVYDELDRVIEIIDPLGHTNEFSYDGLGNRLDIENGVYEVTTFNYDQANRLSKTINDLGYETIYHYDGAGQRTAVIDSNGIETHYEYDLLGRLTAVIADATGVAYRTKYSYSPVGNRLSTTDAKGNLTKYDYDVLNRRTVLTDSLSNVTRYTYDAVGNQSSLTDPNGVTTNYTYDNRNLLTDIDYGDSTPDVQFTYDAVGNRTYMDDGTGVTSYNYDSLSQLTKVNNGIGQEISYFYDDNGNRTELIYPENSRVDYTYDVANRLTEVIDWDGQSFNYTYDEANRLRTVTLPNGITSQYTYNSAGQLTNLNHTDAQSNTIASYDYTLDDVGQRTHLTENLLAPNALTHGNLLTNGGFETGDLSDWYDQVPGIVVGSGNTAYYGQHGITLSGSGRIDQVVDTVPGEEYQVSAYIRIDQVVVPSTWGGIRIQIADFPSWQQLDKVYVDASAPLGQWVYVSFSFTAVSDQVILGFANFSNGEFVASADNFRIEQLPASPPLAPLQANQQGRYQAYLPFISGPAIPWANLAEQELAWQLACAEGECPPLPSALADAYGVYEPQPERQNRTNNNPTLFIQQSKTISYQYDSLYRLTDADYSTGATYDYSYDPVGNRLQQIIDGNTTSYTYDAANRLSQVTGDAVQTYNYSDNGNLLNNGVMTNTWDAANRLLATVNQNSSVTNLYDGLGNRVARTQNGPRVDYALDVATGLPEIVYTSEGTKYLHLPGIIVTENITGETRYLLSDGLGSVRHVTDDTGMVVSYQEYDPYGNPLGDNETNYGYTGEWWETDIDLLHLRARWYMPETGTFLSKDPWKGNLQRPQSMNGWNYVESNPINYVDPSGWERVEVWVSAFIMPSSVVFPYQGGHVGYHQIPAPFVGGLTGINIPYISNPDPFASWHGDGRGFYTGGAKPSARIWHNLVIETNPDNQPYISNDADSGYTEVTYWDAMYSGYLTIKGKAAAPTLAQIQRDPANKCVTTVYIRGIGPNPLTPPGVTPAIDYEYTLIFDTKQGTVTIEGWHDPYPAHEVYLQTEQGSLPNPQIESFSPYGSNPSSGAGPSYTPGDLGAVLYGNDLSSEIRPYIPTKIRISEKGNIKKYEKCTSCED